MATIKDIANLSGVTVTTVSRVMNNRGYISEKTRQKVYDAMNALHYCPNEIARSLQRHHTKLLGLIIPNVAHPFFAEFASMVERHAYDLGYKLLLCNSLMQSDKEREYIGMLKSHQVDGIIMGSHTLDVEEYKRLRLPLIALDRCLDASIPYVASDNEQGGTLATKLLIEKGCRKLASICGNLSLNMLSNKRFDAFARICTENGADFVLSESDADSPDEKPHRAAIMRLMMRYPEIDGLFCSSDMIAFTAIEVCTALGKRIPLDVKIIGYDGMAITNRISPLLTTIQQPINDMAFETVINLIAQIEGKPFAMESILPVSLIERATT